MLEKMQHFHKLIQASINFNTIKFDNVSFSYHFEDKPIFSEVSFCFKRGEIIGIQGSTGSGKSTLVDLSWDYYPTMDQSIDNIAVSDPNNIHQLHNWQSTISHSPVNLFIRCKYCRKYCLWSSL